MNPDPWPNTDPLGQALHLLRVRGAFYCRSEFTEPWGLTLPPLRPFFWFHVVTAGQCWLETDLKADGEEPVRLQTGDLALVPHGGGHQLYGQPGTPAPIIYDLKPERVGDRYEILRHGGGGEGSRMICCAVAFDHPAARHLTDLLPPVIRLEGLDRLDSTGWLETTLRQMRFEAESTQPGGEAIITRLADILVIRTFRAWITDAPAARQGWLGALRDPQIGRAMLAVHSHPARGWTVESLSREARMSRSAFAARFKSLVGESPLKYVTRWRMLVASSWLAEGKLSVQELARRLGYKSTAAFSRAFKRVTGTPPGEVRRRGGGLGDGPIERQDFSGDAAG